MHRPMGTSSKTQEAGWLLTRAAALQRLPLRVASQERQEQQQVQMVNEALQQRSVATTIRQTHLSAAMEGLHPCAEAMTGLWGVLILERSGLEVAAALLHRCAQALVLAQEAMALTEQMGLHVVLAVVSQIEARHCAQVASVQEESVQEAGSEEAWAIDHQLRPAKPTVHRPGAGGRYPVVRGLCAGAKAARLLT